MRARFIPARAGNSRWFARTQRARPVYPRSRGEQKFSVLSDEPTDGLSPLARGTGRPASCIRRISRFIPARAGNRRGAVNDWIIPAVYPRSRGEQGGLYASNYCQYGLSPLARGTVRTRRAGASCQRFIPARAGNSAVRTDSIKAKPVYPRSRGEQFFTALWCISKIGLSPLARGTA
ncbi:hypothetical protein CTU_10260 [Cronobacter turicensis z3032]|nr:hypothetical protein CTU_10260 [Cronobacter turicensis z3032]